MAVLGSREIRVFIVDTDPDLVQTLQTYFQSQAADKPDEPPLRNVGVAYTGQDCLTELKLPGVVPPDIFLINAHLPDVSGIELIKRLNLLVTKPLVVMLLPDGFQHLTLPARQAGAALVVPLPCTIREVETALRKVFAERHLHRDLSMPPAAGSDSPAVPAAPYGTPAAPAPGADPGYAMPPAPGSGTAPPYAAAPSVPAAPQVTPPARPNAPAGFAAASAPSPVLAAGDWSGDGASPLTDPATDADLPTAERLPAVQTTKGGRQLIAVFSAKGGVGKTTTASNLAITLARLTDIPLLVADLDLDNPSLHAHWFVDKNDFDLSDLRDVKQKIDRNLLQKILYPVELPDPATGKQRSLKLQLLVGFVKQTYVDDFSEQDADRLLDAMQEVSPLVLVDLSSHLSDPVTSRVLERCTRLILLLDQDMTAVENTLRFVEALRRYRVPTEKIILVVNKHVPYGAPVARIERAIGLKVALTIPYDHKLFLTAITDAKPVALQHWQDPAARAFLQLAQLLMPSLKQKGKGKGSDQPARTPFLSRLLRRKH